MLVFVLSLYTRIDFLFVGIDVCVCVCVTKSDRDFPSTKAFARLFSIKNIVRDQNCQVCRNYGVYVCMYVCIVYVYMYVCMHASMYVCLLIA